MKKALFTILVMASMAAVALPYLPQRYKWQMTTCPAGTGYDENYQPECVRPVSCNPSGSGVCTGTAPTTDAGVGMSLASLSAWRAHICVPPFVRLSDGGHTTSIFSFGDGGTLDFYFWSDAEQRWVPNPGLSQNMPAGNGSKCVGFPDFRVGGQFSRVYANPNGIQVLMTDGGFYDGGLDVMLDGQQAPYDYQTGVK